jgi:hypothetical protein
MKEKEFVMEYLTKLTKTTRSDWEDYDGAVDQICETDPSIKNFAFVHTEKKDLAFISVSENEVVNHQIFPYTGDKESCWWLKSRSVSE